MAAACAAIQRKHTSILSSHLPVYRRDSYIRGGCSLVCHEHVVRLAASQAVGRVCFPWLYRTIGCPVPGNVGHYQPAELCRNQASNKAGGGDERLHRLPASKRHDRRGATGRGRHRGKHHVMRTNTGKENDQGKSGLGASGIAMIPLVFGGNVFGWTADRQQSLSCWIISSPKVSTPWTRRIPIRSGGREWRAASRRPSSADSSRSLDAARHRADDQGRHMGQTKRVRGGEQSSPLPRHVGEHNPS